MKQPYLLSIDLEAWYHARLAGVRPADFDALDSRLDSQVGDLLELLDRLEARASCFALGAVARRHPELIRCIAQRHEVACHGETHTDLRLLEPKGLQQELRSSRARLQDLSGQPVIGFRAPNWSMAGCEEWALPVLLEEGFRYDSSLVPGRGLLFVPGDRGVPHEPHTRPGYPDLWEFPPTVLDLPALSFPAGGAFMRLLPVGIVHRILERARAHGIIPHLHLHPWELERSAPRDLSLLRRNLLFAGAASLAGKLTRLLEHCRAVAIEDVWRSLSASSA
jgi:polysaccharide deacetylase family protein (PEP-CTERM system associated)